MHAEINREPTPENSSGFLQECFFPPAIRGVVLPLLFVLPGIGLAAGRADAAVAGGIPDSSGVAPGDTTELVISNYKLDCQEPRFVVPSEDLLRSGLEVKASVIGIFSVTVGRLDISHYRLGQDEYLRIYFWGGREGVGSKQTLIPAIVERDAGVTRIKFYDGNNSAELELVDAAKIEVVASKEDGGTQCTELRLEHQNASGGKVEQKIKFHSVKREQTEVESNPRVKIDYERREKIKSSDGDSNVTTKSSLELTERKDLLFVIGNLPAPPRQ